jgi:ATP-binding cassette subfamily F protein 3
MNGDFTVYDTLDRVAVGDIRTRVRDILGAFLFRGGDIDKKVKVLSGGERSRLAMARLMLEPYNLLVLDEPTNHMDMRSKDILKRALVKYDGTVVVVSHDREFLDGLVDKVYEFRDGGVREYLGDIWYFLEKRRLASLKEVEIKAVEEHKEAPRATGKEDYQKRKEAEKAVRKVENAIAAVEKKITELEASIAEWDARLADPVTHGIDLGDAEVFTTYNTLKQRLNHEVHEWEKLNYELDILSQS